jgi:hypothetical protein
MSSLLPAPSQLRVLTCRSRRRGEGPNKRGGPSELDGLRPRTAERWALGGAGRFDVRRRPGRRRGEAADKGQRGANPNLPCRGHTMHGMPVATDASVKLSGTYTFPAFERLLGQLAPLLRQEEPRPLDLDLRGMSFAGPTAIALIQACLRRIEAEGLIDGGTFLLPRNELTRRYILRMDLFKRLQAFVDPEETFHRRKPIVFRPLAGFEDEEARVRVVADLLAALKNSCRVDALAEQSTFVLLTELTENVLQHAKPEDEAGFYGGFAAAQALKKKPTFEIGIVDLGIGIRKSLEKTADHKPKDDVEAIQLALQRGVSSNHPVNSGEGLFVTAEALRDNGGDLLIRSGHGAVVLGSHEKAELRPVDFPGTLVSFRARRDLPLDYHRVYSRDNG